MKRKRQSKKDEDPLLEMATKEHELKMKVLLLKEWKLKNDCIRAGYGLPQDYVPTSRARSFLGDLNS